MNYRLFLLNLIDRYCTHTGLSDARVSTQIFNHGNRIKQIREGAGFTVASFERALNWFSTNWPTEIDWPTDIPKPEIHHDAA
jgi:hypothetical protein